MLETLGQPNVKDFSVEDPVQRGWVFNPEQDVPQSHIDRMLVAVDEAIFSHRFSERTSATELLSRLVVVFNNYPLDEQLKQRVWTQMNFDFKRFFNRRTNPLTSAYDILASLKLIYPKKHPDINWGVEDRLKAHFWEMRSQYHFYDAVIAASNLKILFPNLSDDDLGVEEIRSWERSLNINRTIFKGVGLKDLKLLLNISRRETGLSYRDWENYRASFEQAASLFWNEPGIHNALRYANMISDYAVLTAESVAITDNGIKLTMPEPDLKDEKLVPIPERRQF